MVLITNTPAPGATRQNHSPWLFLDAAHTIFSVAKERVYTKDSKTEGEKETAEAAGGMKHVLEELPKWETLKEVLDEIEHEIHLTSKGGAKIKQISLTLDDGTNAVVIMCTDERTCRQVREFLEIGSDRMMRMKLNDYFQWKTNFSKSKDQLFEKKPKENNEDGITLFPFLIVF